METLKTDVAIVGASIAGSTAAALFARQGLKVTLIERQPDAAAYKRVCTHALQPSVMPTLKRIGLHDELVAAGALRCGLQLWTRAGWTRLNPPELEDAFGPTYALNLRREKLDPLLR